MCKRMNLQNTKGQNNKQLQKLRNKRSKKKKKKEKDVEWKRRYVTKLRLAQKDYRTGILLLYVHR